MLLVLQGYFGYVYASTSLLPRDKTWAKVARTFSHMIFGVGELLMLVLPIEFTAYERIVYSYGPSTSVAYALSAVYILATITITIAYRKEMPGRRFMAMLLWQGIWLLAAAIQFIDPELLLVGFASSFGMVILYIQLENPSEFIDSSTGLFTTNALSAYVHDKYRFGKRFSMFTAKIHFLTNYVDYNMEHDAVIRTARALVALGPEPAFRIDDDTFCVLYDDKDRMFEKAAKADGITGEVLLQLLESRLDNVVFRLGLAPTRAAARQLVGHRHIVVDGKVVNIPSFSVKPGMVIGVREKSKSLEVIADALAGFNHSKYPWIEWDEQQKAGKFLHRPERADIPESIKEQLIVELYSKN